MAFLTLTVRQLGEIELGPRQLLLFDIENDTLAEQQRIFACLTYHVEMHGSASLDDFIKTVAAKSGWSEFKILQHLFWLAHDLKLHFRKNQGDISPAEAKKYLIESPESALQVVLNKPVDDAVFCNVKNFFKRIIDDTDAHDHLDQIEFARRLAREIRDWKRSLEACRHLAQQPGSPNERDIDACLDAINTISSKLDSFSLIHAFFEKRSTIAELVGKIKNLTNFYLNQSHKWLLMVQSADKFKKTIAHSCEDPAVAAAWDRFSRILWSQQPYKRVDEAWRLMEIIKPFHDKVAAQQRKQYRKAAQAKVEALILKMKKHLETHAVSDDLSNKSLYALRLKIKSIHGANTIQMISRQVQAAEEAFEIAWEEVLDQRQMP